MYTGLVMGCLCLIFLTFSFQNISSTFHLVSKTFLNYFMSDAVKYLQKLSRHLKADEKQNTSSD